MKVTNYIIAMATLGFASSGFTEETTEQVKGFFHQDDHTPKVLLDVRARYEYGNQENLDASNAGTIRARVGLESQDYNGFSGLVEFEATRAIDTQSYNALVKGDPTKTPIVDPESTELNRISLQYKKADNLAIIGRQRIILDNARFIGNVGWRQNEQTYDALTYKNTMIDNLALYYGYIDTVQRIVGSDAPYNARKWDSDSHLMNASFSGLEGHKFTGYAYLLDFENSVDNSCNTFGVNYDFKTTIADDYKLGAYAEFAYQQDAGDSTLDYSAPYFHLMANVAREGWSGVVGYELLGSDDGAAAFRTPLATGHKFNGWNDQFLGTPPDGLQDFYLGVGLPVPQVPMKLIYHNFSADNGGASYGNEFDAVASYAVNKNTKAIAKASYFIAADDVAAFSNDRSRFSVEVNYKF